MATDRLTELASRFEPRIQRALLDAFEQLKKSISVAEIVRQLESRGINGVMSLLDNLEATVATNLSRELEASVIESGRISIELMPKQAIIGPFNYRIVNPATAAFVRDYELNLIQQISNDTREAVRRSLQADIISGRNPLDTARTFRDNIGLTARQEQAVRNYRIYLESLDRQALTRLLRDRRFDSTIARAIATGSPLTKSQIDRMVQRYRERFIKYRTEVIARTESLRAVSIGNHTALEQMLQQGSVDDQKVRRFWIFTRDERTRAAHRRIPDMNPDGVGLNESFLTPLGSLRFPRDPNGTAANTIQCRCTVSYRPV